MSENFENNDDRLFEVFLTNDQLKIIQSQLPKGYSLQFSNKPNRRDKTPKTKKRPFEEIAGVSHSSHSSIVASKPTKKIKTSSPIDNASYISSYNEISSNKRSSLRDKKYTNFEHKYADFENTQLGSGFNFNSSINSSNLPKNISEALKKCFKILVAIKKHNYSLPFLKPVDPIALQVPDYYDIVKEPMDLGTVERNLKNGVITSPTQFINEVRKIWNNSFLYNAKGSEIYAMTVAIESYFNKLISEMDQSKPLPSDSHLTELHKKVERLTNKIKELHNTKSSNGLQKQKSLQLVEKPMTLQEKRNLGQNIRNLPTQYLRGVWEIVNDGTFNQHKEELEFDIDTLPPKKCRELERYVSSKMNLMKKGGEVKEKKGGKIARTAGTGLGGGGEKKGGKKGEKSGEKKSYIDMQAESSQKPIYEAAPDFPSRPQYPPSYEMNLNNPYQKTTMDMEEKKVNTMNQMDMDLSKSSDSSFITDSEDSLSEK